MSTTPENQSQDHRLEKKLVIRNKLGLHARPAAMFVQAANQFQSDVTLQKGRQKVNGKSIMGVMMLAAGPGSRITLIVKGVDALKASNQLEKLVTDNFGEE
jgi:phosphotransferase system HPr (HPr) family protein